jgi:hypothetical protein
VASLIGGVEDLVVEDGEVEGKTKTDRVCWRKIGLSDFGGVLVGLQGLICRDFPLVTKGELGEVSVIVSFPAKLSISDKFG